MPHVAVVGGLDPVAIVGEALVENLVGRGGAAPALGGGGRGRRQRAKRGAKGKEMEEGSHGNAASRAIRRQDGWKCGSCIQGARAARGLIASPPVTRLAPRPSRANSAAPMSSDLPPTAAGAADQAAAGIEIRTYFVRGRNALVARAEFSELFVDYYLHQGQIGRQHAPAHDGMFKEALAALALHCASRPWSESVAWTIHFERPLLNLFVTGDNRLGRLVGQIFTDNVKSDGVSRLVADIAVERGESRRSVVDLDGAADGQVFAAVERYYTQSEQRLARFFEHSPEDWVLVAAQPDCDLAWLSALDADAIRALDKTETLSLLETRRYRWECGCTEERMKGVLAPLMRQDPEALFGDEAAVRMSCPRCGARYEISRAAMEDFVKS